MNPPVIIIPIPGQHTIIVVIRSTLESSLTGVLVPAAAGMDFHLDRVPRPDNIRTVVLVFIILSSPATATVVVAVAQVGPRDAFIVIATVSVLPSGTATTTVLWLALLALLGPLATRHHREGKMRGSRQSVVGIVKNFSCRILNIRIRINHEVQHRLCSVPAAGRKQRASLIWS